MAHFIDYGSDTNTNHPQSEIGTYDSDDSFINDDDSDYEILQPRVERQPIPSVENGRDSSVVPGSSPLFVPESSRHGAVLLSHEELRSRLFPSSPPVPTQVRHRGNSTSSRRGNSRRIHGVRHATPGRGRSSGSSTPLIRRVAHQRQSTRELSSATHSWVGEQGEHPSIELPIRDQSIRGSSGCMCDGIHGNPDCPIHGEFERRVEDARRRHLESDAERFRSISTPDPFQIPAHINGDEIRGAGVPGKRQGTGRARWVARFFMFTYAQSGYDWPYQRFIDLIENFGGKYHISRERHEDVGYHFHCLVDFERKFEFENVHKFCVGSPQGNACRSCPGQAHCNILPVPRTPFNAWDYVGKYGDIVASNLERPRARGPNVTRDDLYTGSMALPDKGEFLKDIRKHSARDFILFNRQIGEFGDKTFGKDFTSPDLPQIEEDGVYVHWERYPEIRRWVLESIQDPIARIKSMSRGLSYPEETEQEDIAFMTTWKRRARPKTLIVRGESRLGKTIFATSLGPHIHWHGDFNLKRYMEMDPEAVEYGIFDDISWKNPCFKGDKFKAWLGGNRSFEISDKMVGKFTVKWGKPCIIMTNRDPFAGLDMDDERWVRRNCVFVELGEDDDERSNALASSDRHMDD